MANVYDVAAYILSQTGIITAIKLQKLVYYSQAWSLVWDEEPLFNDRIEAWANGPVSPGLYSAHRLQYQVDEIQIGNADALNKDQRETVDSVLHYYGDESSQWLSDLTHEEDPWKDARGNIPATERSNAEITQVAMAEYYSSLPEED